MKSLLFATGWGESLEAIDRRVGRWARHHRALPWPFEVELAVAFDGVDPAHLPQLEGVKILNHRPHLGRPAHLAYPGFWRSFVSGVGIARSIGARRIIHVESDFFIASPRMIADLDSRRRGWTAYWCPKYGFPETAIQVIVEDDAYAILEGFARRLRDSNFSCYNGSHAEHVLPFTTVERSMVGDRYGETGIDPRSIKGLDFYGQLGPDLEPYFNAATVGG